MVRQSRFEVPGVFSAAVVAFAFATAVVASAAAEDLVAFKQRLAEAVEAGEISRDQAALVMESLSKSADSQSAGQKPAMKVAKPKLAQPQKLSAVDKPAAKLATPKPVAPDLSEKKLRYGALLSELKRAVDAGEITEAQAKEKATSARRELLGEEQKPAGDKKPGAAAAKSAAPDLSAKTERYEALLGEVKRAVTAGEITEAQAKEKVAAARRELLGDQQKPAGDKKPAAVKQPASGAQPDAKKASNEQAMNELKRAVEAGEITPEQAKEKMAAMRGQLAEAKKGPANKAPVEKGGAAGVSAEQMQARYEEIKRQLGEAVSAGKITQEQAEQKLLDLREKMAVAQ